eukprot:8742208-Prorocentrum_lima.AAC.1
MTSSLVGSEMCIRDRLQFVFLEHALRRSPGLEAFHKPCPYDVRKLNTVSYTHLTLPTICSV